MYLSYKYIIFKPNALVNRVREKLKVTEREDIDKVFPPVLSNLNPVVVVGKGPIEKRFLSTHLDRKKPSHRKAFSGTVSGQAGQTI